MYRVVSRPADTVSDAGPASSRHCIGVSFLWSGDPPPSTGRSTQANTMRWAKIGLMMGGVCDGGQHQHNSWSTSRVCCDHTRWCWWRGSYSLYRGICGWSHYISSQLWSLIHSVDMMKSVTFPLILASIAAIYRTGDVTQLRSFGYEKVSICKVADTPFHIQGGDLY